MAVRIIEDRPGQRMVLEGTKELTLLATLVITLGIFFFLPVVGTLFVMVLGWDQMTGSFPGWMSQIWALEEQFGLLGWALVWVLSVIVNLACFIGLGWVIHRYWNPGYGLRYLLIDHKNGNIQWSRFSPFRLGRVHSIPLEQLKRMTLQAGGVSMFALSNLFQRIWEQGRNFSFNESQVAQLGGREFSLCLFFQSKNDQLKRERFPLYVKDVSTAKDGADLAFRMAKTVGLGYGKVFTIPFVGFEARFAREAEPGLDRLFEESPTTAFTSPDLYTGPDLGKAQLPPFDPKNFQGDHKIQKWAPGQMVVFQRNFSYWSLLLLPLIALIFTGPALYLSPEYWLDEESPMAWVFLGIVGLIIGGLALLVFFLLRPRRVVLDWVARELRINTWIRFLTIPFHEMAGLKFEGRSTTSVGGGESGGGSSSVSFAGRLQVVLRETSQRPSRVQELISTKFGDDPDDPFRQGTPLLKELASALRLPGKVVPYTSQGNRGEHGPSGR